MIDPFPRCRLHDLRLVDRLPPSCPGRAEAALWAVHKIRQQGDAKLAMYDTSGLTDLARAQTCERCLDNLRVNPHFQRLRVGAQAQQPKTIPLRQRQVEPETRKPAERRTKRFKTFEHKVLCGEP